ncbi:MAG: transposase [Alphaproteobacteria bacterium]|nr:transposase [Alphaproteobacteria bacterium]MCW5749539.1 transposase [Alphaproteobacteria bacterium]
MEASDDSRLWLLEDDNSHQKKLRVWSFNGRFQNEYLNEMLFSTLSETRGAIGSWKEVYNHRRPHSALGNMSPAEFALKSKLENSLPEAKNETLGLSEES